MIIADIIIIIFVIVVLIFLKKLFQLKNDKKKAADEIAGTKLTKLSPIGSIKHLSILPLIDFYANDPALKTEPGVSYLVQADDTTILMDVGWNTKKVHPSPLLQNMKYLGISLSDLNMLFLSHPHVDHLGGMNEQKTRTFSISQGPVSLPNIPVYAPVAISGSKWNPGFNATVISGPTVLQKGIASIGPIPRALFLMGYTLEHSLAIHVEGKGIVLIIGCGHQTIERIIERAHAIFNEPIYGIIGGLHYPVNGGRIMVGPINVQKIVGSDNPPWRSINEVDVAHAIEAIKKASPEIVGLSAHDSSDWAIDQFRRELGSHYVEVKVGQRITI
jgi:7,8-dihydropterin-6-yl-methyl-4-(beta-D-ribofuranosyl)aminobenzene 5'-phosphate synthase